MKVLNESSSLQSLRVIPRSYPSAITLILRDDQTNETISYSTLFQTWNTFDVNWPETELDWNSENNLTFTTDNDYLVVSNIFALRLNHFYDLTITNEIGAVIYKDKIFCTDQNVDSYSPNASLANIEDINKDWDEVETTWNQDIAESEYVPEETYNNDYIIL